MVAMGRFGMLWECPRHDQFHSCQRAARRTSPLARPVELVCNFRRLDGGRRANRSCGEELASQEWISMRDEFANGSPSRNHRCSIA